MTNPTCPRCDSESLPVADIFTCSNVNCRYAFALPEPPAPSDTVRERAVVEAAKAVVAMLEQHHAITPSSPAAMQLRVAVHALESDKGGDDV